MNVGVLAGLIGFALASVAAAMVAYLKGRPALAAAGLAAVVLPVVLLLIGRWQVSHEDDGLAALGTAMWYGTLMVSVAGALLGLAVLGALLRPRTGTQWLQRQPNKD